MASTGQYTHGFKYICFLPSDGRKEAYEVLAQCPEGKEDSPEWTAFAKIVVELLNAAKERTMKPADDRPLPFLVEGSRQWFAWQREKQAASQNAKSAAAVPCATTAADQNDGNIKDYP